MVPTDNAETNVRPKASWPVKIATATAVVVAAGAFLDAAVAFGTKARTLTCNLTIAVPWCPKPPAADAGRALQYCLKQPGAREGLRSLMTSPSDAGLLALISGTDPEEAADLLRRATAAGIC